MLKRYCLPLVLSSLLSGGVMAAPYHYSDAHLHYVDFFQESAGLTELFKQMDASRIDHVMLSGIPVAKKWDEDEPKRPRYYAGTTPMLTGTAPPICWWPTPIKAPRLNSSSACIRF